MPDTETLRPTTPSPALPPAPGTQPGSRLVVAAAVVDSLERPTSLLCAARSYPPRWAGFYELPGGKVDPGETPTQALVRELAEELCLAVVLGQEVAPTPELATPVPAPDPRFPEDDAPSWPILGGYRMRVWLAQPADAIRPQRTAAHSSLSWLPLDQAADLPWLPADGPILSEVLRRLRSTAQA